MVPLGYRSSCPGSTLYTMSATDDATGTARYSECRCRGCYHYSRCHPSRILRMRAPKPMEPLELEVKPKTKPSPAPSYRSNLHTNIRVNVGFVSQWLKFRQPMFTQTQRRAVSQKE